MFSLFVQLLFLAVPAGPPVTLTFSVGILGLADRPIRQIRRSL